MIPFVSNPFAVLTLIVAPAILTNACSLLSLATSNRMARVVDRTRELFEQMATLEPGSEVHIVRMRQIDRLQMRATHILRAMRLFYVALGGFAATALISVLGAVLAATSFTTLFHGVTVVAFIIGVLAVVALMVACSLLVAETRLAVANLNEEVEFMKARFSRK
jgi:hypothetical protein